MSANLQGHCYGECCHELGGCTCQCRGCWSAKNRGVSSGAFDAALHDQARKSIPRTLSERLHTEIARIVTENAKGPLAASPFVTRETRALLEECLITLEAYEAVRHEMSVGLRALSTALGKPLKMKGGDDDGK